MASPAPTSGSSAGSGTTVARLVSTVLGLAGFALVVHRAWQSRDLVRDALTGAPQPGAAVAALVIGFAGMAVFGLWWTWLCNVTRSTATPTPHPTRLSPGMGLRGFLVGQVAKYVPGGIWAVVGVGETARRLGIPRDRAYVATLASTGTVYVAASAVVVAGAWLAPLDATAWPILVAAGVLVGGLLVLVPPVLRTGLRLLARLRATAVLTSADLARAMVGQLPVWLLLGTATWLVDGLLGGTTAWSTIVVATALSWLVGFLALPVPGGVGVREATFVLALAGAPTAAATAIGARLLFVLVDGAGVLAALAFGGVPTVDPDEDEASDRDRSAEVDDARATP